MARRRRRPLPREDEPGLEDRPVEPLAVERDQVRTSGEPLAYRREQVRFGAKAPQQKLFGNQRLAVEVRESDEESVGSGPAGEPGRLRVEPHHAGGRAHVLRGDAAQARADLYGSVAVAEG